MTRFKAASGVLAHPHGYERPSQNPFNYIKSTMGGKATDTKKFLKFNNEGAGMFKTSRGR